MTISRANAIAVVDLDHVAVAAAWAGIHDRTGRRSRDGRSPRTAKIESRMECNVMRERINARTEVARQFESATMDRRCERDMTKAFEQRIQLPAMRTGPRIRACEDWVGNPVDPHVFHRDQRPAHCFVLLKFG